MAFERLTRLLRARRDHAGRERAAMSPREREFVDESVEDRQAEGFVEEHLGGFRPERLLDGEESDTP